MLFLVFATAVALSAVAAWYSIAGLVAIFSAAPVAIMIMASVMEVAKLVTASVLYRYWKDISVLYKAYFLLAIVVLMLITSMGIFGFLSKAHIQQQSPSQVYTLQIEQLDFQIKQAQSEIDRANQTEKQLDGVIDQYIKLDRITKGVQERAKQKEERTAIYSERTRALATLSAAVKKKFEFEQQLKNISLETGPIRYVAQMLYGNENKDVLEHTVRVLIITLIFVFDPLAVLLLVTANMLHIRRLLPPVVPDNKEQASVKMETSNTRSRQINISGNLSNNTARQQPPESIRTRVNGDMVVDVSSDTIK